MIDDPWIVDFRLLIDDCEVQSIIINRQSTIINP